MDWFRNGTKITENISDYVRNIIAEEKANGYSIRLCIGTDSKVYNDGIKIASVIAIITVGHGGILIHSSDKIFRKLTIKERMIYETGKSVEIARELSYLSDEFNIPIEIHVDINPNPEYESNRAFSEAVGYIKGMNYDVKVKPDSFASSSCADKFC